MKNLKKLIALLLVFILLITVGACGKGEETDSALDVENQNEASEDIPYDDYDTEEIYYDSVGEPSETQSASDSTDLSQTTYSQNIPTTENTLTSISATQVQVPAKPDKNQAQNQNQNTNDTTTKLQTTSGIKSVTYSDGDLTHVVFYPAKLENGKEKYPVIAWANGTGFSYTIYEGLLEKLAEGGYVVIANDETMAADGTSQIASVDFILNESKNSSSVFYKKINNGKIATAGHSQGGRSAVNAAAADARIDCVLSLAGSNYVEETEKLSTPVFFIAGTNDLMVSPKKWIVTAYNACTGPAVYASLDGAGHTTCCTKPEAYSGYAIEWFDLWLKNDKGAKSVFASDGNLSKDSDWVDFACKGI